MRRFIRRALMVVGAAALGCAVAIPVAIPVAMASAAPASAPACKTTVNWIGLPGDGYAGGETVQLEFSNTGKVACTLYGHPGAAQMDAGKQVGLPAVWVGKPTIVTLQPGATAHAVLNVHDAGALCKPQKTTYLNVIAPGLKTAWPDPFASFACPGKSVMGVNPVRAGVGVPFRTIS
jgi:hypothetical protein